MMRKLDYLCRPPQIYNPSNKTHRDYYFHFLESNSWSHCPYQWIQDPYYASIPDQLAEMTVHWYLKQEFKKMRLRKVNGDVVKRGEELLGFRRLTG
jgi:hypothetical protein